MILVAYLEILRSLSTPSRLARYTSRWFKKSLSLDFDSTGVLEFCKEARVVEVLESMELVREGERRTDLQLQYKYVNFVHEWNNLVLEWN